MTKDELQAKRAVALSELKDIEVALCLDEHYIDIIEKENAELKAVQRMALYSKLSEQLAQAKKYIRQLLDFIKAKENGDGRHPTPFFYEEYEQFIKEIEK